jgi:muramoyltetrapeptide carboxypeptidase
MFGQFCKNPSDENREYRFDKMFAYYAARMPAETPVMTGLSYGHIQDLMTIPVGARCRIELAGDSFSFGTTSAVVD